MRRRTLSLIHRGYLHAQKRVKAVVRTWDYMGMRWAMAHAWRQGYLQARRDAKKNTPSS